MKAARPGGKVVIVGMGNPVQTLPISAAALREVDIVGTFRYADTYREATRLQTMESRHFPDLCKLVAHRYQGLDNVEAAFEMAGRTHDDNSDLVLKVVVEMGGDETILDN